jgi:phage-related tail protein
MSKELKSSSKMMDVFDSKIDSQYQEIVGDIEDIQYQIYEADKKKMKKQKKKMKKGKICFYEPKSKKVRLWAVDKISSGDLFGKIKKVLSDLHPIVKIIARLVATLIVSILSLDSVKRAISTSALNKMDSLYKLCLAVN